MKLNATLTVVPLLLITTSLKSQTISLDVDSVEIKSLTPKIQEQTELAVITLNGALNGLGKVSIHVVNKPLTRFLKENICKGRPLGYKIDESSITFFRKPLSDTTTAGNRSTFYWGRFVNEWGEGVENIDVFNWQSQYLTSSDSHGKFPLKNAQRGDVFLYGSSEIDSGSFSLTKDKEFDIKVHYRKKGAYLDPVDVIPTGILQLAKKRSIGSTFVLKDNVLQQRPTPSINQRLEGYIPGLLLTVNPSPNTYQAKYASIGGRSSILSSPDFLLIVNGFPFKGRLEDLNPDDIETITVLRDASATALWGALAGNCVLVITMKTAKFNHPTRVSFNSFIRLGSKPNAFDKEMLAPADRFFVDSTLARNGYYNFLIGNPGHPYVPELALLMLNHKISEDEMKDLKQLDIRKDMNKYFYRPPLQNHLSFQVTGGKEENAYLLSLGFDHSLSELQLGNTQRFNLCFNYNTRAIKGMELSTTLATTYNKEHNVTGEPDIPVTYANLTDASGEPAAQSYKYNQFFIDTAGVEANGRRKLRDWSYRPLTEFRTRKNDQTYMDHRVQLGAKYNEFAFLKGLEAGLYAQYEMTSSKSSDLKDKNGFYANDLVNSFTQANGTTVERPIPVGNILDYSLLNLNTLNLRAQLSYVHNFHKVTSLNVLMGSDWTITNGKYVTRRIYDYTKDRPEGTGGLNYQKLFSQYYFPLSSAYIPFLNDGKRTASNYISYYATANLQLKGKYHAAISVRTDRSNIYGLKTNTSFKPLGSLGAAWDISAEKFYHSRIFELLKLKSSIGITGNPPLGVSAIQTISMAGKNEHGDVFADINNPSLPSLRWETVMTYNAELTFRVVRQILEGTIDYYFKKSTDLVSYKSMDPSVGVPSILGNVASMASHNIDLYLNVRNLNRMLRWRTTFLFSYIREYVTDIDTTRQPAWIYCDLTRFSVVRHRPLYGIYSFFSPGLDENGDPVAPGKNKDYQSITLNQGPDSLHYRGRSTPPVFGSITNEFTYKRFTLSFTFNFKLGYYYRKPSINYTGIFAGSDPGTKDFSARWQKAGDEAHTYVPKMQYPANSFRDYFYIYSDPLVKRADFVRLHNIFLSYDLKESVLRKLHLRKANLYLNCDNAGIVWRATKSHYDPDRIQGFPTPTIFTFGIKGIFK